MRLDIIGTVTDKSTTKGIYLNTISVKTVSGDIFTLDRDTTEYSIEDDNSFVCTWGAVYAWNGALNDYDLNADDFNNSTLIEYLVEDDAPVDYDLKITDIVFYN